MAKREYEWFLEPKDSYTNEVILKNIDDENASLDVVCEDGERRNLWRCPSGKVFMLWRSRSDLQIRFRIFSRELPNGKIKDCTFLFRNERGTGRKRPKRKSYARF